MIELAPIDRSKEIARVIVSGLNSDFIGTLNALAHNDLTKDQVEKVVDAIKSGKKVTFPLVYTDASGDKALYELAISFSPDEGGGNDVTVKQVYPENHPTIEIGFKQFIILEEDADAPKDIPKQKNNRTKQRIRVGGRNARKS